MFNKGEDTHCGIDKINWINEKNEEVYHWVYLLKKLPCENLD